MASLHNRTVLSRGTGCDHELVKERISGGRRAAWVVAVLTLDVAVAAGLWLVTLRNLMVWNQTDTRPPQCSNYYGRSMSCDSNDTVAQLISLGVVVVVLFGSLWIERRRNWI